MYIYGMMNHLLGRSLYSINSRSTKSLVMFNNLTDPPEDPSRAIA